MKSSAAKIKLTSYDDLFGGKAKEDPKENERKSISIPVNKLPSEKAHSYRMKMEELSHQGVKGEKPSADLVGEETGDSGRTVQRYIRLTNLSKELLEYVDQKKISLEAGEKISFLSEEEQEWVLKVAIESGKFPSGVQAGLLKEESEQRRLTVDKVCEILSKTVNTSGPILSIKKIQDYFPPNYTKGQIEAIIFELLDTWKEKQGDG